MNHDILTLTDVRKSFGDAQIIRGVNLAVRAGERHAVIGPNGAGKSTLFHLMSGSFAPTSSDISLQSRAIGGLAPERINRLGLARSFQITNVFPRLSVRENLRLAVLRMHGLVTPSGVPSRATAPSTKTWTACWKRCGWRRASTWRPAT